MAEKKVGAGPDEKIRALFFPGRDLRHAALV